MSMGIPGSPVFREPPWRNCRTYVARMSEDPVDRLIAIVTGPAHRLPRMQGFDTIPGSDSSSLHEMWYRAILEDSASG